MSEILNKTCYPGADAANILDQWRIGDEDHWLELPAPQLRIILVQADVPFSVATWNVGRGEVYGLQPKVGRNPKVGRIGTPPPSDFGFFSDSKPCHWNMTLELDSITVLGSHPKDN